MKFRTAQILALVGILLVTVAIVGISSYRNTVFALRELSSQVLEQTSQRIDQHIDATLRVAVAQSTVYEELLGNGSIDVNDHVGMSRHFVGSIRANPQLSYLSFGTERGEYWHVYNNPRGRLEVEYILKQANGSVLLQDFVRKPDGALEKFREDPKSKRDPRVRPYYRAAIEAKKQTWTETYLFISSGGGFDIPGVTRATPVYRDGKLAGVLTADFDLAALSKFLQTVTVGKSGFAFIVELRKPTTEHPEGERRVIAHPQPTLLVKRVDPNDPSKGSDAIRGEEIDDPRVRAFLGELPRNLRNAPSETFRPIEVSVDGKTYVGGYRKLQGQDLPWIICMIMPEDDVMGSVIANTKTTVMIVVVGIIVAIIVALFLSAAIARTLRELAEESESIGEFQLEGKEVKPSYLLEIRQLSLALEEMKRSLRSFKKFVPEDLVRSLLASGQEAKLGGNRRKICIFFCDIAGFTSIAESMPADELVDLLGEFLGTMSEEIMTSGGTVDKYIGDAIMAFWGAPTELEDPVLVACQVALVCQERLVELNRGWKKRGWPKIEMRIGMHMGEATVGYFGSENRLDYTAIGDAVNLTSRIEGLNKFYGTRVAMSEQAYQAVRDHVIARPLDRVSVKGRAEGVIIYELIAMKAGAPQATAERAHRHAEAMEAYFDADFERAERILVELVGSNNDDLAAKVLLERVRDLAAAPPSDWDGIHRLTSK